MVDRMQRYPSFVERLSNDYEVRTILETRDGRNVGNAIIIGIEDDVYTIRTDFGNELKVSLAELEQYFHTPRWITKEAHDEGWYNDEYNFPALVHNGKCLMLATHYEDRKIYYDYDDYSFNHVKDARLATKTELLSIYHKEIG